MWSVAVVITHDKVTETHDDVIKWTHFPLYWPFVWGIHRSPVNFPHKGQWRGALIFSLICMRLTKRLCKQSRRRWFETPSCSLWRHFNDHLGNIGLETRLISSAYLQFYLLIVYVQDTQIWHYWPCSPSGIEAEIFREKFINNITADTVAPWIAKSSAIDIWHFNLLLRSSRYRYIQDVYNTQHGGYLSIWLYIISTCDRQNTNRHVMQCLDKMAEHDIVTLVTCIRRLGYLLLTWFNFNASMDK